MTAPAPVAATETASDIAAAIVPALQAYPWWAVIAGILVWVTFAAPIIDKVVDLTDTKIDNKVWSFVKAILGGLTRRKK